MANVKNTLGSLTTAILFLAMAMNFNACSTNSPTSPSGSAEGTGTLQSSIGVVNLLQVDQSKITLLPDATTGGPMLFKYTDIEQYHIEQLVLSHKDVTLKVGDGTTGESKVEFKKFNLPDTFNVVFEWAGDDSTYLGFLDTREDPGADIALNDSVKVQLSYKMADMMDVDEASIALYMHDQTSAGWQLIGGEVDMGNKRVVAYIHRFGRFGLFYIKNGQPTLLHKVQDTRYYARKFIRADDHGKLEVDGVEQDKSFIEIRDYDLPSDMTVTFEWAAGNLLQGLVNSVEYGTSVVLNNPVLINVSYQNAELLEVNEDSIQLFIYDESNDDWEALASTVDQSDKEVEAYLPRFGKIALLYTQDGYHFDLAKLGENVFYARKFVWRHKGGTLEVGSKETGKTKIKFDKDDLPEDSDIRFEWAASSSLMGALTNVRFGPHGINFNKPVEVELSYKMADLTGIDEGILQVFYLNEETGIWELIGGVVDPGKRKIKVWLNHFSRYAVAWGE